MTITRRNTLLLFGIPFLTTFLVYLKTVCPTVYTGDSGELAFVINSLGIAHPPGYPLLTLLGKSFITLIPGNSASVLNILSALFAAISAGTGAFVIRAILFSPDQREELQAILIAALTAILWGYSNALWASAVGIEVYTLGICLTLLSLYSLLRFQENGRRRFLLLSIYIFCLGLTNHLTIAALAIPIFVTMIKARIPVRTWIFSISLFVLAMSAYLYLPIRSAHNPIADWDHPANLSALWDHITARKYRGMISGFTFGNYFENLWRSLRIAGGQYPLWLGIVGIAGIIFTPGLRRNIRLILISILLFNLLTVALYDIPDIDQYYLPTVFLSCAGLALLARWILGTLFRRGPEFGSYAVMALLAISALVTNYKQNDQSHNFLARDYGMNILNSLPQKSTLISVGDIASFPVNYLHFVERIRPDLEIYDPIITYGLLRDHFGMKRGETGPSGQELCLRMLQGPNSYVVKEHILAKGSPIDYYSLPLSPMGLIYSSGSWPTALSTNGQDRILSYENQLMHIDFKGLAMLCNLRLCRGEDLLSAGDTSRAQAEFQIATELASHSEEASIHNSLGIFFRHMRQSTLADKEYSRALESEHLTAFEKANIFVNLGNLRKDRGGFSEAIDYYNKALAINHNNTDAHYNLALATAYQGARNGQYGDAAQGFEEALTFPEADPRLLFNLASIYDLKLADPVRAISNYRRFAELVPNLPETAQALRRIQELSAQSR